MGDPNSQRIYDEAIAAGIEPPPRGPKPIVGWTEGDDDGGAEGAGAVAAGVGSPASLLAPVTAAPTRRSKPDLRPDTGPDAWKWKDVPAGRGFMRPVEPGKHRFYIDYDDARPEDGRARSRLAAR